MPTNLDSLTVCHRAIVHDIELRCALFTLQIKASNISEQSTENRVIDQTGNNRQSVCREKKDFPVSDCMFKSCSCPYKVVIIISADLSQRRNCDTKEDADD